MYEKIETYIRPVSINIAWNIEPYFKKFRRKICKYTHGLCASLQYRKICSGIKPCYIFVKCYFLILLKIYTFLHHNIELFSG